MRWNRPPVERLRNGYRINLGDDERQMLSSLLGQLRTLLMGPDDNPLLARLFPTAYHLAEHAEHDVEYQRLMREELVASRLAGISLIDEALQAKPPLTEQQMLALAQGLNGLRLVLGTLLDVGEDTDADSLPDDHPHAAEHQLYGFLSWMLEWTVRSLSGT